MNDLKNNVKMNEPKQKSHVEINESLKTVKMNESWNH